MTLLTEVKQITDEGKQTDEVEQTNEVKQITDIAIKANTKPRIKPRMVDPIRLQEALASGYSPLIARIIAARPLPPHLPLSDAIRPKLKHLYSPFNMIDINKAAARLAKAIISQECIGIETDHDCDGQSSHAVLYDTLIRHFKHPKEKIRSYIGHRLKEGYGLSDAVADRIINDTPRPTLVITADNGSADEPRIFRLKTHQIDVIVTDHHEIPKEGCPKSAYACLNPTRKECQYNDPYIAGCMVAWALMAVTRQQLIELQYLPKDAPSLMDTLDFVAVGTVADCVSMARSVNNRAVVSFGLRLISEGRRACWRSIKNEIKGDVCSQDLIFRAEDLAFKIGPLLNSDGRLSSAFGSVSFLLAGTDDEAALWLQSLTEQNTERKSIQQKILELGLLRAQALVQKGHVSLSIFLSDGHTGVHGIVASRIKDMFGRPTAFMAPKPKMLDFVSGSVRGIDGFHVREALQWIDNQYPYLFKAFGGHQGAGGFTIASEHVSLFEGAFEEATRLQTKDEALGPTILSDGPIEIPDINLSLLDAISTLEPFGREFDAPIFEMKAKIIELRPIGDGRHARVLLEENSLRLWGVWFSARVDSKTSFPVECGDVVKVLFSVKENFYRETRKVDIHIVNMCDLNVTNVI